MKPSRISRAQCCNFWPFWQPFITSNQDGNDLSGWLAHYVVRRWQWCCPQCGYSSFYRLREQGGNLGARPLRQHLWALHWEDLSIVSPILTCPSISFAIGRFCFRISKIRRRCTQSPI